MMLVGRTALSVEISVKSDTFDSMANARASIEYIVVERDESVFFDQRDVFKAV